MMDYKLRVETKDGYHVFSCDFSTAADINFLVREIYASIRRYPRRKEIGLVSKTDLLKDQN